MDNNKWYNIDAKDVIDQFYSCRDKGLNKKDVESRLEKYGNNELPEPEKAPFLISFLKHFNDVLIYILIFAAVITVILGHYIDTSVIIMVVIINACIGFVQENKAEKALSAIKNLLSLKANVLRDGERFEVNSNNLVPGDIIFVSTGDKIPADVRLVECENLRVEESVLTGESLPVKKSPEKIDGEAVLGDRTNMAFSSTSVTAGTGIAIVVATGKNTEIGKISKSLSEVEELKTPLIKQTARFGKMVSVVILAAAAFMYGFGYLFRDFDSAELLLAVIGLAVAAIPEGLPAIVSIILAIGVQNMAKRKAIVRNLPSVETLGAVSVICSDKTGTLTKNEMTVTSVITETNEYKVTGTGYSPAGEILRKGREVNIDEDHVLKALFKCVKNCNDATLKRNESGQWVIFGDPTEGCLVTLTEKAKQKIEKSRVISKIPFDSEYKYMAVLIEENDEKIIYIKGAPDRLLDMTDLCEEKKHDWLEKVTEYANKGQRVIGVAYKKVSKNVTTIDHEDVTNGVVLLGLAGIMDPPREEAIVAIEECAKAGIRVKMITGDHKNTAMTIGKVMGIGDGKLALEGKDIDRMTDDELTEAIMKYDIFARTSPDNKLRLVKALQENQQICAMTGDGVNDAPALKRADIGVAMGIKGTEVAKDASQMVLVDDNFKTIVNAVQEGRRVYDNLKKTILFILPTNASQASLIIASIIFGISMPLTPVQILWVNMVISVTLSLAFAFEKLEEGSMKRPPRPLKTSLLSRYYIFRILFVATIITTATLIINIDLNNAGYEQAFVNSVTLNTFVILQLFYLFNCRSERNFAFNKDFFSNKAVFVVSSILIILQLAILYLPFMNTVFGTVPIGINYWIVAIAIGVLILIIVEIEKFITKKISISFLQK